MESRIVRRWKQLPDYNYNKLETAEGRAYQVVQNLCKGNNQNKLSRSIHPKEFSSNYTRFHSTVNMINSYNRKTIFRTLWDQAIIPIVVDVMEERRPKIQQNGSEIAIAPEPIFLICLREHLKGQIGYGNQFLRNRNMLNSYTRLTKSCSRKQKYESMLTITRTGTSCQTLKRKINEWCLSTEKTKIPISFISLHLSSIQC